MSHSAPISFRRIGAWLWAPERRVWVVQISLILGVITLLNLGFTYQRELREVGARNHLARIVHGWDGLAWYSWVLAAPAMLYLVRRYPLSDGGLRRNFWRFLAWSLVTYLAVANVRYLFRILPNVWLSDADDLPISWQSYSHTMTVLLPLDLFTYLAFFAVTLALDYYARYLQRSAEVQRLQLESARLQSELTRAQLTTLRGQLHPHFLFNSFNAIAMLVRQGRLEPAVETITQLSGLLRMAVDHFDEAELLLSKELAFVDRYLAIERIRFGDKLRYVPRIDRAALAAVVPGLLLQPLVENAIKHGLSQRVTPGTIWLTIRRAGERLHIEVLNDGPELAPPVSAATTGVGLANTQARLRHTFGTDFRLDLATMPDGRIRVALDLPWRAGQAEPDEIVAA
ncbi:MAG: histidine kinase [Verrucomicrobia bacterium]|nr:histidine kinase [Verrucomicrobiota bacterium]